MIEPGLTSRDFLSLLAGAAGLCMARFLEREFGGYVAPDI